MSTGKWKFTLEYSNDMTDDPVAALRAAGFGVAESEAVAEALLETSKLDVAIKTKSDIDPRRLAQELSRIGMPFRWWNEPAA